METTLAKKRTGSFTGSLGFVLATAGASIGLGNIWRFPYLAAKGGGGLFLFVYLILVVTFGFTLLLTETVIGRKTGKSPIEAFTQIGRKWRFLGYIAYIVPSLILTYYVLIGGWILKYLVDFIFLRGPLAAEDSYFTSFITSPIAPIVYMGIFLLVTEVIVFMGVEKGIERTSKILMPGLFVMIIFISVFSLFLKYDDGTVVRTGLQGFRHYVVPSFEGVTFLGFLEILLSAMGQLFFSLSIAMGIVITYGSYAKKDVNLNKSLAQIEFFDTLVAFLAGMMIIPSIYVFSGLDGMNQGPSLLFVSLPKVFQAMGKIGNFVGIVFFIMVLFAALTSSVAILETIVANTMEVTHRPRKKVSVVISLIIFAVSVLISLGYSVFYFELPLPNGSVGQLLDVFDYISNSILMPFLALMTCYVIGWVTKPQWVIDEVEISGVKMSRKRFYIVMVKYIAPILLCILFLQSTGIFNLIGRLVK